MLGVLDPLRDADELKSRGCRKLKRGTHTGVPTYMSVAGFTCVVPLLLLLLCYAAASTARMDAFEIQRKCGLQLVPG